MLLVTAMLPLTSCDDDDNEDPTYYYTAQLVGSWIYEEVTDTYFHTVSSTSVFDFYPDGTFYWTFYTLVDGNTVDSSYIDGTYLFNGNVLTLMESDGYVEHFAAAIIDDTFTIITDGGQSQTYFLIYD